MLVCVGVCVCVKSITSVSRALPVCSCHFICAPIAGGSCCFCFLLLFPEFKTHQLRSGGHELDILVAGVSSTAALLRPTSSVWVGTELDILVAEVFSTAAFIFVLQSSLRVGLPDIYILGTSGRHHDGEFTYRSFSANSSIQLIGSSGSYPYHEETTGSHLCAAEAEIGGD